MLPQSTKSSNTKQVVAPNRATEIAESVWQHQGKQKDRCRLLPLCPRTKTPLKGGNGHLGAIRQSYRAAKWDSDCNVGAVTGDSFFIIDIDDSDGMRMFEFLKKDLGAPPKTVAVQTPKGFHLYYQIPLGMTVDTVIRFCEGIDILGTTRYCVLPGSVVGGIDYRWIISPDASEIAALSETWLEWLAKPQKEKTPKAALKPITAKRKKGRNCPRSRRQSLTSNSSFVNPPRSLSIA